MSENIKIKDALLAIAKKAGYELPAQMKQVFEAAEYLDKDIPVAFTDAISKKLINLDAATKHPDVRKAIKRDSNIQSEKEIKDFLSKSFPELDYDTIRSANDKTAFHAFLPILMGEISGATAKKFEGKEPPEVDDKSAEVIKELQAKIQAQTSEFDNFRIEVAKKTEATEVSFALQNVLSGYQLSESAKPYAKHIFKDISEKLNGNDAFKLKVANGELKVVDSRDPNADYLIGTEPQTPKAIIDVLIEPHIKKAENGKGASKLKTTVTTTPIVNTISSRRN